MTIREIAAIANVSVSTVSKIINKKDESISEETRSRVLKVVKEYNYSPYAKFQPASSSFLLGVSVALHAGHECLTTSIVRAAREEGYSTIVCISASKEDEEKNLSVLCSHNVDGIIWDRIAGSSEKGWEYVQKHGTPFRIIDIYGNTACEDSMAVDYSALGYVAALKLIEKQHQQLGCVMDATDYRNLCFLEGFRRCLFDHHINFDDGMAHVLLAGDELPPHVLSSYTGIVCSDYDLALQLRKQASSLNLKVPRDLSLLSLCSMADSAGISSIPVPFGELGRRCVSQLISQIENRPSVAPSVGLSYELNHTNSIDIPVTLRGRKILVVGSLNMDTLIHFDRMPQMGETLTADKRALIPGGKGFNQAIAASKLGADTYLIGKIGKDHDGSVLHDYLRLHNVNTDGLTSDSSTPTGMAYIYIRADGESSIVVFEGANQQLRKHDIDRSEDLFRNASFCLLHTELSPDVVKYAAKMARRHGVRTILKPCVVSELDDDLLRHIDILMPNEMEVNRLFDEEDEKLSKEEKAGFFLDKGVGTVIITLGHMGCYLRDATRSLYFKAADVPVVDTTGASDAFAATLAVYLSRGRSLETAISYAIYAAGLSTTRQGVLTALVDQNTLDLYVLKKPGEAAWDEN